MNFFKFIISGILFFSLQSYCTAQSYEQLFLKAEEKLKAGECKEAIKLFTECLLLKPDSYLAYYERGLSYQSCGNTNDALKDFLKSINIAPDYSPPYYYISVIHRLAGKTNEALQYANKSIKGIFILI